MGMILGAIVGFAMALAGVGMFATAAEKKDGSTGNAGCATFMIGAVIFAMCLTANGGVL